MKRILLTALLATATSVGCDKAPTAVVDANDPGPAAQGISGPPLFAAPAFSLTDQDGRPFGSTELKGKTWIATLFYTSCPGPCPMMAARLKKIQDAVANPNVEMVSVSIDPDHDTPEKMKAYATAMGAKAGRWYFLTGPPQQVKDVAAGLKLGYEPGADNKGQIVHSTLFLLVDKAGQVRGVYHTDDEAAMKQIQSDAQTLAAS